VKAFGEVVAVVLFLCVLAVAIAGTLWVVRALV